MYKPSTMNGWCINPEAYFELQNAHSSRSHAIVIITVEKKSVRKKKSTNIPSDKKQTTRGIGIGSSEK